MEIVIHGTKGGYKVLYQTPNVPFSIARDVRRIDRNDGNTIGQSAYSIAFADRGFAFTKYRIVRDVERAAVGNVAFSVYIPSNKKIAGNDVKNLLNQLVDEYCQTYIVDGNLSNRPENWTFVDDIANQYESSFHSVPPDNTKNYRQGTDDAAFVYYSSEEELQKYFDMPYQEIYKKYRQIFFVDKKLENVPENPLNALRHNPSQNLTGQIDLEKIKRKILLEIKDCNGKEISGAKISCQNANSSVAKNVSNNEILFEDEELKDYWIVSAEKDNWITQPVQVVPEILDSNSILLILDKYKVTFLVNDDEGFVSESDYKIQVKNEKEYIIRNYTNIVLFSFEQINNSFSITISHTKHENESESFFYCPAKDENPKHITLRKKQFSREISKKPPYQVNVGEYGNWKNEQTYLSNDPTGYDVKNKIIPNKGYELIGFELQNNILIAQYKKIYKKDPFYTKPAFMATSLIGFIAIIVILCSILFSDRSGNSEQSQDNIQKIVQYCNGREFNIDTLKNLQLLYCIQSTTTIENNWKNLYGLLGSTKKKKGFDTELTSVCCPKIEQALAIFAAIENGDIDALRSNNYFSGTKEINSAYKDAFGNALRNKFNQEKTLNLGNIADFLNNYQSNLQTLLQIREDIQTLATKADLKTKITEVDNIGFSPLDTIKRNIKEEINKQIQRIDYTTYADKENTLSRDSSGRVTIKNSNVEIEKACESEFLKLVNKSDKNKQHYVDWYKVYKTKLGTRSWNNEYIIFYDKYLSASSSGNGTWGFDQFKSIPNEDLHDITTLDQLEEKLKNK